MSIPEISIHERFFHPLEGLSASEKKKLTIATVVCGILFPIVGGVIAFFVASTIFKNRHIKPLSPGMAPANEVALQIISPGKPTTVSEHCKELLDCCGLRPDAEGTFDSNKLLYLVGKLLDNTPHELLDEVDKKNIVDSPVELEAFLQRVNDYNLVILFNLSQKIDLTKNPKEDLKTIVNDIRKKISTEKPLFSLSFTTSSSITCIPLELFQPPLSDVKYLTIRSKNLYGIPSKIGLLQKLEILEIQKCESLTEIPSEISLLKKLKKLEIIDLPLLKKLPDEICNIKKLEKLRIEKCPIHNLPQNLGNLQNLGTLVCIDNENLIIPDALNKELRKKLPVFCLENKPVADPELLLNL